MDMITLLVPFFVLGIVAALLHRISGVAMSMITVPVLLCMGARPLDVVSFMAVFSLYLLFTTETQDMRMGLSNLTFFSKWKALVPVALTLVLTLVYPALGVTFFLACFILEVFAAVYKRQAKKPSVGRLAALSLLAALATAVGVLLLPYIPLNAYFLLAGGAILLLTIFAWYACRNRRSFTDTWDYIWSVAAVFFGLFGVEAAGYPKGAQRSQASLMDAFMPLIYIVASFVALIMTFLMLQYFSLPAFIAALGAAFTVRMVGLYSFSKRGAFSYLAIAIALLAVVSLYLVWPQATGFEAMNALFAAPIE